ncbi:hypothetical protein D3C87_1462380 [compost metagenome]
MAGAAALFAVPAAPLVVVVAVGFVAGLVVQWAMVEFGVDNVIGNAMKIENP